MGFSHKGIAMKKLLSLMLLGCAMTLGGAHAADTATPVKAPTAQQNKMGTCNADAKTKALKGDARKKFMSGCLSADGGAVTTQQSKMKTCNTDASAKALKGDARKKFLSTCLKG
jgi:hypothetical protein